MGSQGLLLYELISISIALQDLAGIDRGALSFLKTSHSFDRGDC